MNRNLWERIFPYVCLFIIAALGGVLIWVLHINVIPYQKLAASMLSLTGSDSNAGFGFLNNVPFLSDFINFLQSASAYLIGIILFCLVQVAELGSKIVYRMKWLLRKALRSSESSSNYAPRKGDKGVYRRIKVALSTQLVWAISFLETNRNIAYIIDAFICFIAYPFIKNLQGLVDFFSVFLFAQIDLLLLFALTVKGVETILDWILAIYDLFVASRRNA